MSFNRFFSFILGHGKKTTGLNFSKLIAKSTLRKFWESNPEYTDAKTAMTEWYNYSLKAEQKVHVVYNGLPESKIPEKSEKYTLHQIGLVANIRPIKRMQDLIKALKRVRDQVPDATIVIIGGGDDAEPLISLATEIGVNNAVTFVGAQPKVSNFIKQFHVAVLCSESEGFSNAIMEYMAHAKPVVCSDVGGNSELVEHGVNGYLYPVGEIDTLAKYLIELLKNTEKTEIMGEKGYNKIITQFTMDNMVGETVKVYELMGRRVKGWMNRRVKASKVLNE